MPKPTKGPRLGGTPAHQRIILANLASQLFEHGRVTTTEAKAKRVQPLAETLITKAKRGDLHSRRLVLKTVSDQSVVHTLFTEIAPTFADRNGGYTRITKVGNRKGDNAPMAVIELVTETVEEGRKNKPARPAKAARPAAGATAAATPAPAADAAETEVPSDAAAEEASVEVPATPTDAPTSDPEAPAELTDPEKGAEPAEGTDDPAVTEQDADKA